MALSEDKIDKNNIQYLLCTLNIEWSGKHSIFHFDSLIFLLALFSHILKLFFELNLSFCLSAFFGQYTLHA